MNNLINKINLRFESGNSVPVDSVRITREEWEDIQSHIFEITEQRNVLAKSVKQALMITSDYYDNDSSIGDALNKMERWSVRVMGKSPEWDALVASKEVKS